MKVGGAGVIERGGGVIENGEERKGEGVVERG